MWNTEWAFLPMQLIYQGTTPAFLPKTAFPTDWLLSYTPNHWSNEEKTHEYIQQIILPYLTAKRRELCLPESFPALIFSKVRQLQVLNSY